MHPKLKRKGLPRRNWILVGIAAAIALIVGIGIGSMGTTASDPDPDTPAPLATATPLDTAQTTPPTQTIISASDTCNDLEIFPVDATVYNPTATVAVTPLAYADDTASKRDESLPDLPVYADSEITEAKTMTDADAMMPTIAVDGDFVDEATYGMDGASDSDEFDSAPSSSGDVAEASIIPTSVASMRPETTDTYAYEESRVTSAQIVQEPLRAGEIDDNADWDTYQEYRRNYFDNYNLSVDDVDVDGRQVIRVVDNNGAPVLGACVEIYQYDLLIAQSNTYATGQTLFFPNAYGDTVRYNDEFRVVVSKGDATAEANLDREAIGGVTQIMLDLDQQIAPRLDVLFLLDATGSMSDEIRQLQDNILSISAQIDALPENIDTRYGLVAYRDRGDEYITQRYNFTNSVSDFQRDLNTVVANGGGDTPESLNQAFYEGLTMLEWRGGDTIKLVFLVADAPPHLDYQDDVSYAESMQYALTQGIKVHPIASGGLDNQGEFILRQIAQHTMGKFIFLTYDNGTGGSAGDDRTDLDVGEAEDEQGVGDYSVSQLDELVLRLITDELAALRGE